MFADHVSLLTDLEGNVFAAFGVFDAKRFARCVGFARPYEVTGIGAVVRRASDSFSERLLFSFSQL